MYTNLQLTCRSTSLAHLFTEFNCCPSTIESVALDQVERDLGASPMKPVTTDLRSSERLDRLGAIASSLCAAHCAVCALLPMAFGALGFGFLLGHEAEWMFTMVAVTFASCALFLGWRRHRSGVVAGLLILGIVGLLASRGLEMGSAHHDHDHGHHGHAHALMEPAASHGDSAVDAPDEHRAKDAPDHTTDHAQPPLAHQGTTHLAGSAVGILAGMLLLWGHLLNLRATRQCRQACCT